MANGGFRGILEAMSSINVNVQLAGLLQHSRIYSITCLEIVEPMLPPVKIRMMMPMQFWKLMVPAI